MNFDSKFSRRDFLKYSGLLAGALILPKDVYQVLRPSAQSQPLTVGSIYGRMCDGDMGAWREVKTEPNVNAPTVRRIYRDEIVEFRQEVIATSHDLNNYNQRWVDIGEGFVYSPYIQKTKHKPNVPLQALPLDNNGSPGMWVEITVPISEAIPSATPVRAFWARSSMEYGFRPQMYYNMVMWAHDLRVSEGQTQYLLTEKYGAEPDSFWVDAAACRPITAEETTPIHPDVPDKKVIVDLNTQTLYCLEGQREVYFCEVSTGGRSETGDWGTPPGMHTIWRKMISTHMSAGGQVNYDTPGIGWTTLFDSDGAAIHCAYWHNAFGTPRSHGCVNCYYEDAHWIWRWTSPFVDYYPGERTIQGLGLSTLVDVRF